MTGTRRLTYAELDSLTDKVAAAMISRGLRVGDRVTLYAENRWEWLVTYHGALKAGAVVNPLNVMLTPEEVRFALRDCGASFLFASGDRLSALDGIVDDVPSLRRLVDFDGALPGVEPFEAFVSSTDDVTLPDVPADATSPCTIAYTSGTTGLPKGAVQSRLAIVLNCVATAQMHARGEEDVLVTGLPCAHVYGNVSVNSTLLSGGTVVLMERFDPSEALRLIDAHRATMFEGVPAMYSLMLNAPDLAGADLSSLTRCTVGGQTIARTTVEEWERRTGAPLVELWGMTELAGLGTTHDVRIPPVRGSVGVPLPGLELRVADLEEGTRDAPVGQPGELMARGSLVMMEYYGDPGATEEVFDADGWLHTGDVARVDESGYYFVVDRLKDMIITGGYNIYPAEIERVVSGHPAVALVAVGAVPDPVRGELARAYVVLRTGSRATAEEIIDFCRPQLAAYKVPRSVAFVPALPQTSTGKIMRRHLEKL